MVEKYCFEVGEKVENSKNVWAHFFTWNNFYLYQIIKDLMRSVSLS